MRVVILRCLFLLIATSTAYAEDGLIHLKSSFDVKETADRLESRLIEKGMKVFVRINHQKGASSVGKTLAPTELLIFGNPNVGTPLMQCASSVAIDLPQKALIWEDKKGEAWLTYNDPMYLVNRHKIEGCETVLGKLSKALNTFAKLATNELKNP